MGMYLWWSLCTLYILTCQVIVITGYSGFCSCVSCCAWHLLSALNSLCVLIQDEDSKKPMTILLWLWFPAFSWTSGFFVLFLSHTSTRTWRLRARGHFVYAAFAHKCPLSTRQLCCVTVGVDGWFHWLCDVMGQMGWFSWSFVTNFCWLLCVRLKPWG